MSRDHRHDRPGGRDPRHGHVLPDTSEQNRRYMEVDSEAWKNMRAVLLAREKLEREHEERRQARERRRREARARKLREKEEQ